MSDSPFTEDDLDACWTYYKVYLLEILNGTYSLDEAREDLASLRGSKWDKRTNYDKTSGEGKEK